MPSDPGDVRPRTSALSVFSTRETTRAWTPFAKRHGVSEQTIYSWHKRYGEFDVAEVRRLCELEQENARLKKMVAERDLEINVMKEIAKNVVSVPARRHQVAFAMKRGLSQRRACGLLSVARSAPSYELVVAKRDAPVVEAMQAVATVRRKTWQSA